MSDFIAYYSRWRMALLFLSAVGFVVLGAQLAGLLGEITSFTDSPKAYIGWVCIAFFGLCAVVIGKRFFDGNAQLSVGADGIFWSQWSDKLIPWSEITKVSNLSYQGQKFIVLHLKNPNQFPGKGLAAKLAVANRFLTRGDICISLTGTDRSFDEAMSAIESFRNA